MSDNQEEIQVSLKSHRRTVSGECVSVVAESGLSMTSQNNQNEILRETKLEKQFLENLENKLSVTQSAAKRMSEGSIVDKSPASSYLVRSHTVEPAPSLSSLRSDTSFVSTDEVDSAFSVLTEGDTKLPGYREIKNTLKQNAEMNKIRVQLEDQLSCLDSRMEEQRSELSDIQEFFKRRAEIEKKYSRDLEGLFRTAYNKHKDVLRGEDVPSSTAILRELVKETKYTARNHAVVEQIFGTVILGRCQNIGVDVGRVYKQCRDVGAEIQESLLGVLYELHTKTKIYQTNKENFELAQKKLKDAEKDIMKLEKEIKPERREKTRKYINAQKQLKTRQIRKEDSHNMAIKAHLEYNLCTEAANAAIRKYYKDDVSDLINCMDLGFHHLLKNALMMRTSAIENLISSEKKSIDAMDWALGALNSRKDKDLFLAKHPGVFSSPTVFEARISESLQANPEDMDSMKGEIQEKIVKLRDMSEYTAKVMSDSEAELLLILNKKNFDMTSHFMNENEDMKNADDISEDRRHALEEIIIDNNKRLISANNRIEQEEAKYGHLKATLVAGQFCSETMPRARPGKRKNRIQTSGLPKIFGGSLDDYYEATGEKIPLVVESCIRAINLFGMKHLGIFRINGAHVDIKKFKEAFENGEDPFGCMMDGNHINSVSGILKIFFGNLAEPLFSETYFDQFMNITRNYPPPHFLSVKEKNSKNNGETLEFVMKAQTIIQQWSEPHVAVTRYLFAFLQDLSQYSEETQMDPFNLAICFGPNLCPIPEGKNLVQHTNLVNDLIKNFIIYCDDIFNFDIDAPRYENINPEHAEDEHIEESQIKDRATEIPEVQLEEAVALYDYTASTENELSFSKGDKLLLYSKASDHWWKGSKDGVKGLIAANYIEMSAGSATPVIIIKEDHNVGKASGNSSEERRDDKAMVTNTMSFQSNRSMWENIEKEKQKSKTLDTPRKHSSQPVIAPDLLKDLLGRTLVPPGVRPSGGRVSPDRLVQEKQEK